MDGHSPRRKQLTLTLIAVFLAVQLTVPALAMFGPRPARFAWQMYSGVRTQASFAIVQADGETVDVALRDYLGNPRLDIDLTTILPDHICDVEPEAVAVRITAHGSDDVVDQPCIR